MKEFVVLRAKTCSYLKDNNDEDKKSERHKKLCQKKKTLNYKNCLEAAQIENKISHLEKNKIDVHSPKVFIRNNKLILKTPQRFKSERHNVFTDEINKIALSSNDD